MKKLILILIAAVIAAPFFNSCKKGEEDPFLSFSSRKARLVGEWTIATFDDVSKSITTYVDDPNDSGELIKTQEDESVSFDGTSVSINNKTVDTYDGQGGNGKTSETDEYVASGSTVTTTRTVVNNSGTNVVTETGDYTSSGSMTYTFNKDGTFESVQTHTTKFSYTETETGYTLVTSEEETETKTIKGTWSFLDGNKTEEFGDKERVALFYTSVVSKRTSKDTEDYTDTDAGDWWNYNDDDNSSENVYNDNYTTTLTNANEIWQIVMLKGKEMKVISSYTTADDATTDYSYSYTSGGSTVTNTSTYVYDHTSEGSTTMTFTQE